MHRQGGVVTQITTIKVPSLLSLVVPVLNEYEAIGKFIERINTVFEHRPEQLEILFVNDGSTDGTLPLLIEIQTRDSRIKIVDLSRNFGKEAALSAGLAEAQGQVVVPIDVDLQDPPELIIDMLDLWGQGYDVVTARRSNRRSDTASKRISAKLFFRLHNSMASQQLPADVGDFRLLDRIVVNAILQLPENCRFMKGIFAWVGFRTTQIDYVRAERVAGKTKFNGWKLWNFALEGITSFSTAPLRMWTYIGFSVSLIAFLYAVYIALRVFLLGISVPGYASIIVTISLLGGMQIAGIGVIGEYLGRTYLESKRRPVYLIRRVYLASER